MSVILFVGYFSDFKKENGFHEMPSVVSTSASPYHMPIVGQENVHYNGDHKTNSHFDDPTTDHFDAEKYGPDDVDSLAPIIDIDDHHFDIDNSDDSFGIFDFGQSPFKYHHDVSNDGLKGDSYGFDNQVRVVI